MFLLLVFHSVIPLHFVYTNHTNEDNVIDYDLLDREWNVDIESHPDSQMLSKLPTCFGIPGWSSFTCHGHGNCMKLNDCECWPPFTGLNCTRINWGIYRSLLRMMDLPLPWSPLFVAQYPGPTCFEKNDEELGACGKLSDHQVDHGGACYMKDECLCYCGYHGPKCEHYNKRLFEKKTNCIRRF